MPLNPLQRRLERIYDISIEHRVEDFLISSGRNPDRHSGREALLVSQQGDELGLSLYVDADVLAYIERGDPFARPQEADLDRLCVALEGVSHFLYLAWMAGHDRPVSLLELELQAEVDKYVALACAHAERPDRGDGRDLHRRLFQAVRFDPRLDGGEQRRYRAANHYAGRYCAGLERRYGATGDIAGMVRESRRFYRLLQRQKLGWIARTG
ncbi:MAG: hypothetical protein AB7Q97_17295 [Gammaproteobacteria bacterium]